MQELYIASDHGGYKFKQHLKLYISSKYNNKYSINDLGPISETPADYPDYSIALARKVQILGIGILICGTGEGMVMSVNKFRGIRAALCNDVETAKLSKEHNDSNVLCMGERIIKDLSLAERIVDTWLTTEFSNDERHIRRLSKFREYGSP